MSQKKQKLSKKRPLRILYLPVDEGGCGWMRVRQFDEAFHGMKDTESYLMTGKESPEEQNEYINEADIVVSRLPDYEYVKLIKEEIDPTKIIVFDHDDNTMEVLPSSEHYGEFGTVDAWAKTDKGDIPVWVTGITPGFNRYKNLSGQMRLLYMLGVADLITAPVENLLELYSKFASPETRTELVYNCLNRDLFPKGKFIPSDKKDDEIRIGWEGGVSHMGDWNEIKEELWEVSKMYPEVTFHILGSYYVNQFKPIEDKITKYPWYPFRGYTFRIKTMGLDGCIIPLEDKPFNTYKSELKFLEFSALEVPCLVKNIIPYSRVIKDGENCWSFKDKQEFKDKLIAMIQDIKSGKKQGNRFVDNANEFVWNEREITKEAKKVREIYKSLLPEEIKKQII